ncbi:hypothetical protein MHU86_8058 [Fragilaria crotonensis]|nr:hypothetical protein MHU86_8058 [Fragilaria crotonensis]
MRSFISRSTSPLLCRKKAEDLIFEINEKEKTMFEELTQRQSRGIEVEKVGEEKIAIWDQGKEGSVPSRGRSFNRIIRSRSRSRINQVQEPSLESGFERSSSLLSRKGAPNGTKTEARKPDAKGQEPDGSALSRGRSLTRLLRSRSGSRRNLFPDQSLEHETENTGSFLNWKGASYETRTEARKEISKVQEPEASAPSRRRSFTQILRSRSLTRQKKDRGIDKGESKLKLKKEDLTDVHSALKEMEKQLKAAKKHGQPVSRESVMDALRFVVESLDPTPPTKEYKVMVESTADTESVGETTTDDISRYTYGSYTTDGQSQFTADYTHDSNDTRSYGRDNDSSSLFSESTEGEDTTHERGFDDTTDGRGYDDTSEEDHTEADDGTFGDETSCDDATYGDDMTYTDSIGTSYASGEGFRIGQTNFVIKPPDFSGVFPTWGNASDLPEAKLEKQAEKPQTSMLQQIAQVASFGAKSEAPPISRTESSLEVIQANVKKLSQKSSTEKSQNSINASPSFASFSASDIYATDQFRALSPFGSPTRPDQPGDSLVSQSCNAVPVDFTSWLKVDDTDLKRLWDDLLWRNAPEKEETRAVTPTLRPQRFSGNLSQDSIDKLVLTKQRSHLWPETAPTEASSSPSVGNSPERASKEAARKRGAKKPKSWFGRRKADTKQETPTRVVVCSYADACSPMESPFPNVKEIKPSAGDYLRAVSKASQRYLFDEDDDDEGAVIGAR